MAKKSSTDDKADASPASPVGKTHRQPAKESIVVESLLASVSFSVSFWMLRQGVARHRLISLANAGHILLLGGLAQLGERLLCKQEVSGSSPLISTNMGR